MAKKHALPPKIAQSLDTVLNYSWDDELASAKEIYRENGTLEGHVFLELVAWDQE